MRAAWGLAPEQFAFAVVGGYHSPEARSARVPRSGSAHRNARVAQRTVLIIGRGNMTDILRMEIVRLGLSGKAWLTPYCTDMPAAMNAIDCLVHPAVGTEAFRASSSKPRAWRSSGHRVAARRGARSVRRGWRRRTSPDR